MFRSTSVQKANALAAMKTVRINELSFYDLRGSAVSLKDYFQNYALLIFLRHLA